MNKLIGSIFLTALALQYSAAAEDAASTPPAPSPAEAAAEIGKIEVKSKSAFTMQENGRNPFWPIGWKPAAKQIASSATAEPAGPEVQASAFLVSSIVMDPRARFAIINGKVMNEGQVFGLQMGSATYQITVKSIQDGQVILVRGRDQEIAVPLRRR